MPESTTLTDLARSHRLYGHDRGDGWVDLYESTVPVPTERQHYVFLSRCKATTLRHPEWLTWSIGTLSWFLVVAGDDDRDSVIEGLVDVARADDVEHTSAGPDARHVRLAALSFHLDEAIAVCGRIDATIDLLPESEQRRLAAVAAILRDVVTLLGDGVADLAAQQ